LELYGANCRKYADVKGIIGIGLGKNYKSRFPVEVKFDLLDIVPPLSRKASLFEGEILEKWTKLILCAHINIRQSRNSAEANAVAQRTPDFEQRLSSSLKPGAFYGNLLPVTAILSTFHKIALRYGVDDSRYLDIERLKELTKLLHSLERRGKKRSGKLAPKFIFEKVEANAAAEDGVELQIRDTEENPMLVFTRTFPLLMGRPHDVSCEVQGVPSCERCKRLWSTA